MKLLNYKKTIIAAVLLFMLIAGFFATPFALRPRIEMALHNSGFPQAWVGHISFMPNGIFIDKISLDANQFSLIQNIQIEGNWLDLSIKQQAERISIKSVELSGELDANNRITIAGWDGKFARNVKTDGQQLPFKSFYLDGMTVDLSTPIGAIRAQAKANVETRPDLTQIINASVWSAQKQLTATINLNGKIDQAGTISGKADISDTSIDVTPLAISRLSGWIEFRIGTTSSLLGQLMAGGMRYSDFAFEDINLTVDTAQPAIATLKTRTTGHPVTISAEWLTQPDNTVLLRASAANLGAFASLADMENELLSNSGPIEINASVKMNGMTPDKEIKVQGLNTSLAGGNTGLRPFSYYLDERQKDIVVELKGIKLSELTGKETSVIADGTVSGTIPLRFKNSADLTIHNGVLKSDQPGSFKYQPKELPASLQGDDPRMETVRLALSNYNYDSLEVLIDGPVNGNLKTVLKAKGKSPAFENRPVNLNLNLEGALAASIRQALQPGSLGDTIQKNLNKGAQ